MENFWSSASLFTEAAADKSRCPRGERRGGRKRDRVWTVFFAGDYNHSSRSWGGKSGSAWRREEHGQPAEYGFFDEGESFPNRTENSVALGEGTNLRPLAGTPKKCSGLYAARRSPLRQRKYPPRHGAEQDSEGFYR